MNFVHYSFYCKKDFHPTNDFLRVIKVSEMHKWVNDCIQLDGIVRYEYVSKTNNGPDLKQIIQTVYFKSNSGHICHYCDSSDDDEGAHLAGAPSPPHTQ